MEEWRHLSRTKGGGNCGGVGGSGKGDRPVATFDRERGQFGQALKEIVKDVAVELGRPSLVCI